ncbi:MAG: phage holin family protein [Acutalibacteraceae bacterium]|nr:phage holin family protein [Acutalibacteraceae bacterium]
MNYEDFVKTELLMLIPVTYLIGIGFKKSKLPDKWIPIILGIISVILSALWVFSTSNISGVKEVAYALFTAVTQGILVAGASVYANQLFVQAKKEE